MEKNTSLQRRRTVLKSVTGSLLLPSLASFATAGEISGGPTKVTETAAGQPRRFVAVGNLLGFQQKHFFPVAAGKEYEDTTLLNPLKSQREKFTVYRGLDHGLRGGHFAVHTFLSGVLHHESKNRHDGNVTLDQYLADSIGGATRFSLPHRGFRRWDPWWLPTVMDKIRCPCPTHYGTSRIIREAVCRRYRHATETESA